MIKNDLKYYIRDYAEQYLTKSKSKDQYVCIFCGSGTGQGKEPKFTGGLTVYDEHFYCFRCIKRGDIFDLCCKVEGIEQKQVVQYLAEKYKGIPRPKGTTATESTQTKKEEITTDYTEFFRECNKHLQETDYHRGISLDTLNRFLVGYCAEYQPPNRPKAPKTPKLIVPTSKSSYFVRDTRADDEIPEYQKGYTKVNEGKVHILNAKAISGKEPVFIVEGEIDALSVIDVGGQAVGLGGTSNTNLFFSVLDDLNLEKYPLFIVSCDNDTAGQKANKELQEGFTERNIPYITLNVCGNCKDQNEALMSNRAEFGKAVQQAIATAKSKQSKKEEQPQAAEVQPIQPKKESSENKYYNDYSADSMLNLFWNTIQNTALNPIPTGFKALDKSLNGGLIAGLYCIGAVSSLGKTTFALQIADNIAKNGKDVLIFSLEMSKNELIAKSISRCTSYTERPQTAIDVMNYKTQNTSNQAVISQAINEYHSTVSKNLFIREGQGKTTAKDIHDQAKKHLENRGSAPVIILDYLQILSPIDDRATDKQNIDTAILTLKQLSRDLNTPVIVINSFNRDSYDKTVAEKSFKESGAIEYSSDVLIGLQLQKIGKLDITALKRQDIRKVELIILKNRSGVVGDKINFDFKAKYNVFTEITGKIQANTEETVNSNIPEL